MDNSKSCFRGVASFLILLLVLICGGCRSESQHQAAYDQYYAAGYQEAFQEGDKSGKEVGSRRGASNAEEDAANGESMTLYWTLAFVALGSGLGFGLISQYGVMLRCRKSGRLPLFSTVLLVPAMKSSLAYSIFTRDRDRKIKFHEGLSKIAISKDLDTAGIQALEDATRMKFEAMSNIAELTDKRIVQLFEEELQKIVDQAEHRVRRNKSEVNKDDDILDL